LPKGWQTGELPKPSTSSPAAKPKTKPTSEFPKSLDKLETVRSLRGSTGAILVRDPATDRLFVLKRGNSADHLREEFAADMAYQALGVPVPKVKLYETPDGPVKLAEFIEDARPLSALRGAEAEARLMPSYRNTLLLMPCWATGT
jgi:hypothetical protein